MYLHLRKLSPSFNSLLQAAKERKAVRMRARLERLERRLRLVQRQAAQGRQGSVQRLLRARLKRRRQRIRMKRYRRGRLIWMTKIRRRPILMLRILIL